MHSKFFLFLLSKNTIPLLRHRDAYSHTTPDHVTIENTQRYPSSPSIRLHPWYTHLSDSPSQQLFLPENISSNRIDIIPPQPPPTPPPHLPPIPGIIFLIISNLECHQWSPQMAS